jgi:hypothetical protein
MNRDPQKDGCAVLFFGILVIVGVLFHQLYLAYPGAFQTLIMIGLAAFCVFAIAR